MRAQYRLYLYYLLICSMGYRNVFLFVLTVLFNSFERDSWATPSLSLDRVKTQITTLGVGGAAQSLFASEEWGVLAQEVARGTDAWVGIATQFRTATSGAIAESLDVMIGTAISKNPRAVLRSKLPTETLYYVCRNEPVDEDAPASESIAEFLARERALSLINDKDILTACDVCLQGVRDAIKDLNKLR